MPLNLSLTLLFPLLFLFVAQKGIFFPFPPFPPPSRLDLRPAAAHSTLAQSPSFYQSVCLFVRLFVSLSDRLWDCLSFSMSVFLSVSLSASFSVRLSISRDVVVLTACSLFEDTLSFFLVSYLVT